MRNLLANWVDRPTQTDYSKEQLDKMRAVQSDIIRKYGRLNKK